MSFIARVPPMPTPAAPRSAWRWFPWALAGVMLLVFAANGGLIYWALATFPGATNNDGFDESNAYDGVLAKAAQEAALGWSATAEIREGRAVVRLKDAQGRALPALGLAGTAARPLGPKMTTPLRFTPAADGSYVATMALPQRGQWDLALRAASCGQDLHVTRRVVVP